MILQSNTVYFFAFFKFNLKYLIYFYYSIDERAYVNKCKKIVLKSNVKLLNYYILNIKNNLNILTTSERVKIV